MPVQLLSWGCGDQIGLGLGGALGPTFEKERLCLQVNEVLKPILLKDLRIQCRRVC